MNTRPRNLRAGFSTLLLALLLTACGGEKPEALLASAKDYLAKNDSKAAVIQIKNALQKNPELPEARFLLGKALFDSGDPMSAEVELRKALDFKYPADEVVPLLARAMIAAGQSRKAVDEFSKMTLSSPKNNADLQTSLALAQLSLGNRAAANTALTAALAAQPDHSPALVAQAQLAASGGDIPGALAMVDKVLQKSPANPEAQKLQGDLLRSQGNKEGAEAAYRQALAARADYTPASFALVSLLNREGKLDAAAQQLEGLKKTAPRHGLTQYLEAEHAYRKKDYTGARDKIQQLLKQSPDSPPALELAGAIEFQLNSFVQAESHLSRALSLAPDSRAARRLLVALYLRTGQSAKAMSTLEPLLGTIENDSNMQVLAGQVFMLNGNVAKAEEYFVQAAKLDPKNAQKQTSLALAHLVKGDASGAFNELEGISTWDTGITADMALIAAHLRRNDFDRALTAIAALEKKQPDNPMVHQLRGGALLAKKDEAAARKSFEKALALKASYLPAASSLATLDMRANKPEDAKKRFETLLVADPANIQALLALAQLKSQTGAPPAEVAATINKAVAANPTDSQARIALIEFHLASKDVKKALSTAQEAATALPDRPEIVNALGRVQHLAGDSNQALATYGKLAAARPTLPLPHLRMAEIYLATREKDKSIESLRKAISIKPDLVEAQRGLIMLLVDAGKSAEALSIARDVQKQRPKEPVGYLLEGDIAAAAKDWNTAIAAYRNGLKKAQFTELAIRLHSAHLASGKNAEADKWAGEWLKEHSKDAAFRLHLGDVATGKGDWAAATRQYQSVLEVQPDQVLALNNLAWVSGQANNIGKAIEYAEKANKLAPNRPAFMDTLGMLLAQKGDTGRALELLRKALELSPQDAGIRLNLAKVMIKAGKKSEAGQELDTLTKLGDKFPKQAEVEKLKKEL